MWCKSIFNYRFVLGLSNLALSVGSLYLKSDNFRFHRILYINFLPFLAGMWFHFTSVRICFVHRHKSYSIVSTDWCEQRSIITFVTSVFLLYCARTSGGWINRYICVIHWMVGNMFEQLLYSKYCKCCMGNLYLHIEIRRN